MEKLDELLPQRVFRSRALKRQIVEETLQPGARAHGHAAGIRVPPSGVPSHPPGRALAAGSIHIEFGQTRLYIDGAADAATVRVVLGYLRGVEGEAA